MNTSDVPQLLAQITDTPWRAAISSQSHAMESTYLLSLPLQQLQSSSGGSDIEELRYTTLRGPQTSLNQCDILRIPEGLLGTLEDP